MVSGLDGPVCKKLKSKKYEEYFKQVKKYLEKSENINSKIIEFVNNILKK